jgi:hypothetical protein
VDADDGAQRSRAAAVAGVARAVGAHPAARLLTFELRLLRALALLALRRVDGLRAGDVALSYARAHRGTALLFLGIAVAEVVAVEVVVPWPLARNVLLLLGLWTLLVVGGLVALEETRPHLAGPDGIVVRHGATVEARIPWELVAAVERRPRHDDGNVRVVDEPGGPRLHLPVAGSTAIDVVLAAPVTVRLRRRQALVRRVSLAVDDADAALAVLTPPPG